MKKGNNDKFKVVYTVFIILLFFFVLSYITWYLFLQRNFIPIINADTYQQQEEPAVVPVEVPIPETEPVIEIPEKPPTEEKAEEVLITPESPVEEVVTSPEAAIPVEEAETQVEEPETIPSIPPPPTMKSAFARIVEQRVIVKEDPFADFYIAGEDELILEDGIYYMSLYVNNSVMGMIETQIENSLLSIYLPQLRSYVSPQLVTEAYTRIFPETETESEYISLIELEERGVSSEYLPNDYEVRLYFGPEDMPVQVINLSGNNLIIQNRPLEGTVTLQPTVFSLKTIHSLSFSWNLNKALDLGYSLSYNSSNYARLYSLMLDFSYTMRYSKDFSFDFNSYKFYHDFEDQMLRLSVGNVSTGISGPSGTPIGISLEKDSSFAAPGAKIRKSYDNQVSVEKESRVIIENNGKIIFDRVLQPGVYRFEEFVLESGSNKITVTVSPTDGTLPTITEYEQLYSSSLLTAGEYYYGVYLTTGREKLSINNEKRINTFGFKLGEEYVQYDPKNIALSGYVTVGLTNVLSLDLSAGLSNKPNDKYQFNPGGRFSSNLIYSNLLGTSRLRFSFVEERLQNGSYSIPQINGSLGHQVSFENEYLSSLSLSLTYNGPNNIFENNANHYVSINASTGGSLWRFKWAFGGSVNFNTARSSLGSYSIYSSLSFSPAKRFSMSFSLNVFSPYEKNPTITGRIYGSYSFSKGSASISTSNNSSSAAFRVYSDNNSFSMNAFAPGFLSSVDTLKNLRNYTLTADYSHSNRWFSLNTGVNGTLEADRFNGYVSMSTSTVFADGFFTLASSIPNKFVLLKQEGILKGNKLSVGYSGYSSMSILPAFFDTSIYSGLSTSRATDFMVMSSGSEEEFTSPTAFSFRVPASKNKSYVYKLSAEGLYTVSGIVEYKDQTIINISSPLYDVLIDDEGRVTLSENDSQYLFTDEMGRYVLSSLPDGIYGFDIPSGNNWVLYIVEIRSDQADVKGVNMYENSYSLDLLGLPSVYSDVVITQFKQNITAEEFWSLIYPDQFGEVI